MGSMTSADARRETWEAAVNDVVRPVDQPLHAREPEAWLRGTAGATGYREAMTDLTHPDRIPAGATPEGDGIITGNGRVRVDAFIDFLCPFCRQFELSAGPTLADLISETLISLAHHPMN